MQDIIYYTVLLNWKKKKVKIGLMFFLLMQGNHSGRRPSHWGQRLLMENAAKMAKAQEREHYETLIVLWFSSLEELDKN